MDQKSQGFLPRAGRATRGRKGDGEDDTSAIALGDGKANRWLKLRRAGWLLAAAGLVGSGGVAGWFLRAVLVDDAPRISVTVDRPVSAGTDIDVDAGMPSLVGLSEGRARQALFDAGVGEADFTFVEAPAAGTPGVVIAQEPLPGGDPAAGITVTVSVPADVPDLIGRTETEVRAELAELGARVRVERVFDPGGAAEGTVVGSDPAPNERLSEDITLTVAAAPSSVYLAALQPVSTECSTVEEVTVNATAFAQSVVCPADAEPSVAEYVLNRRVTQFETTVGQDDRGDTGGAVIVRFFVDGQMMANETVAFGDSTLVQFGVLDALRLRIEVSAANPSDDWSGPRLGAVLAEARVIGSPDAIEALVAESER